MLQLKFEFERHRLGLSVYQRLELDRLTRQLAAIAPVRFQGRETVSYFTRAIQRAAPSLSEDDCEALAFYALCGITFGLGGHSPQLAGDSKLQGIWMSFNQQYLQVQSSMQHENRMFTSVSNILKTKHDTVKNSISNIR